MLRGSDPGGGLALVRLQDGTVLQECVRNDGGRCLGSRGRGDGLLVDGVVGIPEQNVGEAGLQQVHREERRLLNDLQWGGVGGGSRDI